MSGLAFPGILSLETMKAMIIWRIGQVICDNFTRLLNFHGQKSSSCLYLFPFRFHGARSRGPQRGFGIRERKGEGFMSSVRPLIFLLWACESRSLRRALG